MNLRLRRPVDPAEARRRFRVSAFLVPIAGAVVGAAFMALGCVPMAIWGVHVLALVPAIGLGLVASRTGPYLARHAALAAGVALAPVAATLAFPGLDAVHRWLGLGPVTLHPSAILAPVVVTGFAFLAAAGRWPLAVALVAAAQALHVAQPDAGQAFALVLAATAVAFVAPGGRWARAAVVGIAAAGAIAAALRFDPLQPVRHAEGILALAAARGLAFAILARLYAAVLPLPAFIGTVHAIAARDRTATAAIAGLCAYELGAILATRLGAFPVPVLGFGASHLAGFLIANGLIVAIVSSLPLPVRAAAPAPAVAVEPPA